MDRTAQGGGPGGINGSGSTTRAEKFEDEKRRIVESCFSKKDSDGSLSESYITHIRIIEDAAYPSSPPPPNSRPEGKKPRLIIVAVRKSGRVRLHKARENANGSFSIGKTWNMDELSAVQSYNGSNPTNAQEEQFKEWAGGVGFVVVLGKPYYWQANTQKEKQFFIASLVKIYTKYTGGKVPELIGFDNREREQLLGASAPARPQAPNLPSSLQPPGLPSSLQAPNAPSDRALRPSPSRDQLPGSRGRDEPFRSQGQFQHNGARPFTPQTSRPSTRSRRDESPNSSIDSAAIPTLQPLANLRRIANNNQSQDSFARSDDGSSLPPRSRGGHNDAPSTPGRFPGRSTTPTSQRATTPESGLPGPKVSLNDAPPLPAPLAIPPERRRPPMPPGNDPNQRGLGYKDPMIPAPLASPGMRRDDMRSPQRNVERTQPRNADRFGESLSNKLNGEENGRAATETMPEPSNPATDDSIEKVAPRDSAPVETAAAPILPPEPTSVIPPSASAAVVPSPSSPPEPEEETRPGLGPMIKKKSKADIASTFLKAAKTASAFKPRAGGAAERLREAQKKAAEGPDGITSVVPAPSLVRVQSDNSSTTKASDQGVQDNTGNDVPEVKVTIPQSRPVSSEPPEKPQQDTSILEKEKEKEKEKMKPREVKRPKLAAEIMQKELAFLGIEPNVLQGKGDDIVTFWDEFGYTGERVRTTNIDEMKEEIERELNKAQTGGWLTRFNEEDERIEGIKKGIDQCIAECDELDNLFTLYLVELDTLTEDIAYIEAQSQGLQVQAANQKLLQAELKSLLDTVSIPSSELGSLREASLESPRGLEDIENALVKVFRALMTIDPSNGSGTPRPSEDGYGKSGGFANSEIGSMRVLQEKKSVYMNEIAQFLRRLKPFLQVKFAAAIDETRKALEREKGSNLARSAGRAKLDPRNHDLSRNVLWRYSPLMLFAREVDRPEWEELIKTYDMVCKPLYQDEFRDAIFSWKRIARKPTGDEGDLLFTSQIEKQAEGIATTARKLTVKRSQTLAKSLRPDSSNKISIDKTSDGRLQPYEVFGGILDEMVPIICMEQNFLVEFFHVSSLEQQDFTEAVGSAAPEVRRGSDLKRPRVMEPNRDLAKQVVQYMDEIYTFIPQDIQSLVDWSLQNDPLQGVGVIAAIERKLVDLQESNQEFLSRALQKAHSRLLGLFSKFLDEQIRAIEETKVKINKRKGVIAFMRIFPSFSLSLETMLVTSVDLEIRQTVNQAYTRINKTMFESLKVIARENPAAQTAGADPEDKEALNYQILLIENMNHYLEEVDTRSNPVLEEWRENANQEMDEHMSLYLGAVIRRPLGKLLDFLESIESLMQSRQPGDSFARIATMPSHSKSTFKKILAGYDSKEIRRGIETLRKRVEKHFGDADDPGLSRSLVLKVLQNCEKYYEKVEDRILTVSRDVYDGEIIVEWTKADVSNAFKR
ncbi:exocyst complex component Sec3-domain-containing protein [Xylogone sp. PMI_703]|nr:exocyst complex component Sec3-domain-containing protein [Xylogone sp. PMI_703]